MLIFFSCRWFSRIRRRIWRSHSNECLLRNVIPKERKRIKEQKFFPKRQEFKESKNEFLDFLFGVDLENLCLSEKYVKLLMLYFFKNFFYWLYTLFCFSCSDNNWISLFFNQLDMMYKNTTHLIFTILEEIFIAIVKLFLCL